MKDVKEMRQVQININSVKEKTESEYEKLRQFRVGHRHKGDFTKKSGGFPYFVNGETKQPSKAMAASGRDVTHDLSSDTDPNFNSNERINEIQSAYFDKLMQENSFLLQPGSQVPKTMFRTAVKP